MAYTPKIAAAFVKVQEELKNPSNSAYNPISHSKYAPLSDILNFVRPILSKQKLAVIQNVGSTEKGKPFVQTILVHESGETIETRELCLDSDTNKRMSTLQEMGSSVTYGKRYQLCAFLGIAPEDDNDGNEVKTPSKENKGKPKDKPKSKPGNGKPGKPQSKPSNKPKSKPETTTTTDDGTEIKEFKGENPSNKKPETKKKSETKKPKDKAKESIPMETPETNELLLKIKDIAPKVYDKFKDIKNKDTITEKKIVAVSTDLLGEEVITQDTLGRIKEALDV